MKHAQIIEEINCLEKESFSIETYNHAKYLIKVINECSTLQNFEKSELCKKIEKIIDNHFINGYISYPLIWFNQNMRHRMLEPLYYSDRYETNELIICNKVILEEYTELDFFGKPIKEGLRYVGVPNKKDEFQEINSPILNYKLDGIYENNENHQLWYLHQSQSGLIVNLLANSINELVTPLIVGTDIRDGVVKPIPIYGENNIITSFQDTLEYKSDILKIYLDHNSKKLSLKLYKNNIVDIKMIVVIGKEIHYFKISFTRDKGNYYWTGNKLDNNISKVFEVLNKTKEKTYKKEK